MKEENRYEPESDFVKNLRTKHGNESWKTGLGWYVVFFLIPPFGLVDFLRTFTKGIRPNYRALLTSLAGIVFHALMGAFGLYDMILSQAGLAGLDLMLFLTSPAI